MIPKIRIHKNELGLWFRNGDFHAVLEPGAYTLPGRLFGRDTVEIVDTLKTRFEHRKLAALVLEEALRPHLTLVDLHDEQRALLWKDGRLATVFGPGMHAFWKRPHAIEVETFDVGALRLTHDKIDSIAGHADAKAWIETIDVAAHQKALLFVDGQFHEELGPGRHVYWRANRAGKLTWRVVDLRQALAEVSGQEIMTADKVTLRLNLLVTFRVVDPLEAISIVDDYKVALYREAQLALRALVGTRKLEQLLADKAALGAELHETLAATARAFGVAVDGVGLRDVILPGEMKTILNQVIEAEKRAEANLIRRREETAAARSQANTARLLAQNPELVRMKELEALQEILAGTKATFILGAGDLADQIRSLTRSDDT